MSRTTSLGPFCGSIGCRAEADAVIDHPERGEVVACGECAEGQEVVRYV